MMRQMNKYRPYVVFCCLIMILWCSKAIAADYIIIQSTTSTRNSGLLEANSPKKPGFRPALFLLEQVKR